LKTTAPAHVSYALFRNGLDFVHLFVNSASEDASVLTELDSFKTYSEGIADRCAAPPEISRWALTLLDSYGLD
jgi:hypothetical protein